MKKLYTWIRSYWPILSILLLGAFLRLYKISSYMTFLGDEGRDALVVKRMIVDGKWTLLGPTASVGGFFMGPIYYYFMAPFLFLSNLNPVGPAIMVALVGIATIFIVYLIGSRVFDKHVGVISALLYAVSPLIISYSRSSWNPNVVPFFSTLLFYLLWKVAVYKSWKRVFWIGVILGIGLQLHYTYLSMFGVVGLWLMLQGRLNRIKEYCICALGFIVGFSPFLLFELRHGFMNIRSIIMFVFEGKDTGFSFMTAITNMYDVYFRLFGRLLLRIPEKGALGNLPFIEKTVLIDTTWILALSATALFIGFYARKKAFFSKFQMSPKNKVGFSYGMQLLLLWIVVSLCFFGFYKKNIYDYYFGMLYFAPFLITGLLLSLVMRLQRVGSMVGMVTVLALVGYNLMGMPFRYTPNNQLGQVELIAREVVKETGGKPFNFALITGGNSDHAYRYFFEIWGRSPVTIENTAIDPERKTVTDQLLIVCEDTSCKPLGNSLWEVAGFGRAEIVREWDVSVVKLFKLKHYEPVGTQP